MPYCESFCGAEMNMILFKNSESRNSEICNRSLKTLAIQCKCIQKDPYAYNKKLLDVFIDYPGPT